MTVRELHIQFIQRLSEFKDANLIIETDTLLGYLDRSQENIVTSVVFEEDKNGSSPENILEKIGATKRFITVSAELVPVVETGDKLVIPKLLSFSVPTNFLYYIKSFSFLKRNSSTGAYVENTLIDYSDIGPFIQTETNLPYLRRPIIIQKELGYLNTISDHECDITKIQITYIRKPKKFSFDVSNGTHTMVTEIDDNILKSVIEDAILSYVSDRNTKSTLKQILDGKVLEGKNKE